MIVIPAVDIKDGKCVRLKKGNPKDVTVYYDDPIDAAKRWKDEGARLIHVIDLDGTLSGQMRNIGIIENIRKKLGVELQVGGGVRDMGAVEKLVSIGVNRIIMGSLILDNIDYVFKIFSKFNNKIILALDFLGDYLATSGWQKVSKLTIKDAAKLLEKFKVKEIMWTDIERDGTLEGIDPERIRKIAESFHCDIMIAGGIKDSGSIRKIKSLAIKNIKGVIVGKALYENRIKLSEFV